MVRHLVVLAMVAFGACDVRVDFRDAGAGGGGVVLFPGGGGTSSFGGGSTGGGAATAGGSASAGGAASAGGSATGGGTGLEPFTCSPTRMCPNGQFCFNGLCAIGCQTNANCAADQFCDTEFDRLCHNRVVPTCTNQSGCASTQVCVSGFCSTPPPMTQCDPNQVPSGMDGCDMNSLCVDPVETNVADPKCYSFPACAPDKTCPTGLQGAVCNDGLIPNKGRVCLTGLCRTVANCPSNWACIKFTATDVLGVCSSKGVGSPCTAPSECLSGNCLISFPGFPGLCQ